MSASADIQTRTEKDVLSVPLNAVTTREAKAKDGKTNGTEEVVFILNKTAGTIKKVKVSTAIQDLNYIQIKEGLKDGDEVITGPYAAVSKILNDGSKVTVTTKDKVYDDKNTSDKKQ